MKSVNLEQLESDCVAYGEKFLKFLSEGSLPIKIENKVTFIKIPMLTNISMSVRVGLKKSEQSFLDLELVEFIANNMIRPYSFDVVGHLARRIFNYSRADWKSLDEEVRNGFLSMTSQSIKGAIAKGRVA